MQTKFLNISKIPFIRIKFGFSPETQRWFNICKPTNAICHINGLKDRNQVILSVDIEKAINMSPT